MDASDEDTALEGALRAEVLGQGESESGAYENWPSVEEIAEQCELDVAEVAGRWTHLGAAGPTWMK
jgi:hypothetical protein